MVFIISTVAVLLLRGGLRGADDLLQLANILLQAHHRQLVPFLNQARQSGNHFLSGRCYIKTIDRFQFVLTESF